MVASRELQLQFRRLELCLPRPASKPPAGLGWIYEIKHDGFRILAERDAKGVTLHTRRGYSFADRFPLATAAVAKLQVKSCLIDGEAIVSDVNGLAVFDLLRQRWGGESVTLCAFDPARAGRKGHAPRADRGAQGRAGETAAPVDRRNSLQ